ncbi:MAG: SDR family NAD(P)-dependent oxidoreductase [Candidatus Omnitrophota bacterium]
MAEKKNILIMGGAGGIGQAVARQIIHEGAEVILADCDETKINTVKHGFTPEEQERIFALKMDMTKPDQVAAGLQAVKKLFNHLDAVIVTAAVHSSYPVEYLPDEIVDRVLDVNLISHIKFIRTLLPTLKDGSRIIAVSSIAASVGIPMESLYSASKAGLEMFYESLSVELAYRGIRCVLIQPGNINTGFNETGNDYRPRGNTAVDTGYQRVVNKIDSRHGMPAKTVAETIHRALKTPSPKFCYVVGLNALKAHWAKRLLGRDLALKTLAKFFGF